MKIPKYIEEYIDKRAKCAIQLNHADCVLCNWLDSHNIEVEEYDTRGGCEMYCSPYDSADHIRQAILDKEG